MVSEDIVTRLQEYNPTQQEVDLARLHLEAANEIELLRRWKQWGLHVSVCHIKGKTCWLCVSPDYQDLAIEYGTADIIKKETRENGGWIEYEGWNEQG